MSTQLNEQPEEKIRIEIPFYQLPGNLSYAKKFLIALLLAFGTSLFSCNTFSGRTVGEIAIAPLEKDSAKKISGITDTNKVKEKILLGDTIISQPVQKATNNPKCELISGVVITEHTQGEVYITDTLKSVPSKDSTNYPKIGKIKTEPN